MKKTFYVKLELDTEGTKHEIATYLDHKLSDTECESTVYDSFKDLTADEAGPYKDGEIVSVDNDGCLILWDGERQEEYNCGEYLEVFNRKNLTDKEKQRIENAL
jgi:hypothetical protein